MAWYHSRGTSPVPQQSQQEHGIPWLRCPETWCETWKLCLKSHPWEPTYMPCDQDLGS